MEDDKQKNIRDRLDRAERAYIDGEFSNDDKRMEEWLERIMPELREQEAIGLLLIKKDSPDTLRVNTASTLGDEDFKGVIGFMQEGNRYKLSDDSQELEAVKKTLIDMYKYFRHIFKLARSDDDEAIMHQYTMRMSLFAHALGKILPIDMVAFMEQNMRPDPASEKEPHDN